MDKKTVVFISVTAGALALSAGAFFILRKRLNSSSEVYHTVNFNSNGGSLIESVSVKHGAMVARPNDPILDGYRVKSWMNNEEEWLFSLYYVTRDLTLTAEWELDEYSISYDLGGGTFSGEVFYTYNYESELELPLAKKNNYVFGGWFTESNKRIDDIYPGTFGNLSLTARWYENLFAESLDDSKGFVVVHGDEENPNQIDLVSKPTTNKYHAFVGWYDENNNLLSTNNPFTTIINRNKTDYFYAKYMTDLEEEEWNDLHGVNLLKHTDIDSGKEYITYGLYPQTVVLESAIIENLEQRRPTKIGNYYLDGEYYIKQKSKLHNKEETTLFDNGQVIENNKDYWFRFDPVKWNIFKDETDSYQLLSNKLLDTCTYQKDYNSFEKEGVTIEPNNYQWSNVRAYLNDEFYNCAFYFSKKGIVTSEIDNSPSTTLAINNPYCCQNTNDNVFLLSFVDYLNMTYNADSNPKRQFKTTDFARIKDAKIGYASTNKDCGYCWTRSPYWDKNTSRGYQVSKVNMQGTINMDGIANNSFCIQPSIVVSKS